MKYDITKLRQVTPAGGEDGGVRFEFTDGVVVMGEMTIFDFLRETKDLR